VNTIFRSFVAGLVSIVCLSGSVVRGQTVSVVTFGPGEATFEKFGHTALWVHDDANVDGVDKMYNWGLFEADNELDLLNRFIRGRLEYWMEPFYGRATIAAYGKANRTIWVQDLDLTGEQKFDLLRSLERNALPENSHYKYDYYRDNCTTRVRDAIDVASGKAISADLMRVPTGATYRDHTRRVTAVDPVLYTALEGVLGPWVDRPIDAWEESFLPFELQRHLRGVKVERNGSSTPLVTREYEAITGTRPMPATKPPFYVPYYGATGVVVGGLMLGLGALARRSRFGRAGFFIAGTLWSLFAGLSGAVMLFGWCFTDHVVSYANENLLQTNPLLLAMPVFVVAAMLKRRWGGKGAVRLATVVLGFSAVGLVMKALPMFRQVNWEIIALCVPVHAGLLLGVRRLLPHWQPTPVDSPNPASLTVEASAIKTA
jgi:hypothetical protein